MYKIVYVCQWQAWHVQVFLCKYVRFNLMVCYPHLVFITASCVITIFKTQLVLVTTCNVMVVRNAGCCSRLFVLILCNQQFTGAGLRIRDKTAALSLYRIMSRSITYSSCPVKNVTLHFYKLSLALCSYYIMTAFTHKVVLSLFSRYLMKFTRGYIEINCLQRSYSKCSHIQRYIWNNDVITLNKRFSDYVT